MVAAQLAGLAQASQSRRRLHLADGADRVDAQFRAFSLVAGQGAGLAWSWRKTFWPKTFENHLVGPACRAFARSSGVRTAQVSKRHRLKTLPREQWCQRRQIGDAISHKLRPRRQGRDQIAHAVAQPGRHQVPIGVRPVFGRDDAANEAWAPFAAGRRAAADRTTLALSGTAIATQNVGDAHRQAGIAIEAALLL